MKNFKEKKYEVMNWKDLVEKNDKISFKKKANYGTN